MTLKIETLKIELGFISLFSLQMVKECKNKVLSLLKVNTDQMMFCHFNIIEIIGCFAF